ncbi:MAG: phytanoyl-CoA dioxygenase family protein [Halioglobus sp.]
MSRYQLQAQQRKTYAENGFIHLPGVFTREQIARFERDVSAAVAVLRGRSGEKPPNSDSSAYAQAFTQVMNLWRDSEAVRELVFNRDLARLAAQLMGVSGVRLYHDQALYKEAHGGYTPWHCDQYYWPLDSDATITAWIPLQDTRVEMGALAFSAGSHRLELGRDLPIGEDSEKRIAAELAARGLPSIEADFAAGDVSFHAGWTFHRAGPNATDFPRRAMTVIYMAEDMRLKAPENANQQADRKAWCPGIEVGEVVASELNPVLYRAEAMAHSGSSV